MEHTVCTPQKSRLEIIYITFTDQNTTWFDEADDNTNVSLTADFEDGLVIADSDYSYPILIYDISRSDINYNKQKAEELREMHIET